MFSKGFPLSRQVLIAFESRSFKLIYSSLQKCDQPGVQLKPHRRVSSFPELGNRRGEGFSRTWVFNDICACRCFTSATSSEEHEEEEEEENDTSLIAKTVAEIREHNLKLMSSLLGVDQKEIRRVSSTYKIKEDRAKRTLKKLEQFGFSKGSALMYPELLFMNPGAVENYIKIMQETGFMIIREEFITKFRSVIRRPLLTLRVEVGIPTITKVVERFCDELEMDEIFLQRFIKNLPKNTDRVTLFELRRQIIASYLSRLSIGDADEIYERFFNTYPRFNFRSLNWIKQNYRIFKELEFDEDKLRRHCYLLSADPENVRRVIQLNSLAGVDIKTALHRRPRIAISAVDGIIDIQKAFVEHEIPFESIQKHLELFTLSPKTIRKRLEQLDSTPEFRFLKIHPRISRLLYYQRKAMERLEEYKTMDVIIPSIHLLSQDKGRYNKSVAGGEIRTKGVDIITVVARMLKVNRQQVRQSLMRHPHWIHVPTLSVKETLTYLQSLKKFSVEELVDAIPLMLYQKDKVEEEVKNILSSGVATLDDPYFLNMVMYFIERPTHFTGDGIWPDKMIPHDDPEDVRHDDEDEDHDDALEEARDNIENYDDDSSDSSDSDRRIIKRK